MSIWVKQRRSRILNEPKQVVIDTRIINVLEIMNKYEQQQYNYVKSIAKSLERIAIALESNQKSGLSSKRPQVTRSPKIKHV